MTSEERATEAFNAYLGSLDITEEGWLKMNREKAVLYAKLICCWTLWEKLNQL
jgi:hypothetical protein